MPVATHDLVSSPVRPQLGWIGRLRTALMTRAYRVLSDQTLVQRARARDYAAFDALVARYRRRLYTMAFGSLGDEGEARQALRETVLQAFADIDSFGRQCTPGTWLYLQGFRSVFKRMNLPPGKYVFENRAAW